MQAARIKRVRYVIAAAIVLAAASSTATAQFIATGISMTVSAADPEGSWALQQDNIFFAHGSFAGDGEFPSRYVLDPIVPACGCVGMSWLADSEDGFAGSMVVFGKEYVLTGIPESFMELTAGEILVNQPGLYQEPFELSATLCAPKTFGSLDCDVRVEVRGMGKLSMLVGSVPGATELEIERIDWTMGKIKGTPEPGTLALFGLGLVGIGFMGRRRSS